MRKREKGTERERHTHTHTERATEIERQTEIDRQTQREKETETKTERERQRETETERQRERAFVEEPAYKAFYLHAAQWSKKILMVGKGSLWVKSLSKLPRILAKSLSSQAVNEKKMTSQASQKQVGWRRSLTLKSTSQKLSVSLVTKDVSRL